MPELADIFRVHAPQYLEAYYHHMLPSHWRAIQDIIACRSGLLGGHEYTCDGCGHVHHAYHSCCNRSCPKCQSKHTQRWVEKREKEVLPITYYHIVFTLPKEFRTIVWHYQEMMYDILIKAAAKALKKLAKDPRYIGGQIGFYTVLHTWTRALLFHPHVHCLVPGGGVSNDGRYWIPGRKGFFVPKKPLSIIFRAIFIKMARKLLPHIQFPQAVWKPTWVVHVKKSIQGPQKVLKYLGRYIHRIAITNNRILSCEDGNVTFRYKDSRRKRWKIMTLPSLEFMRRFLQHVLPKGFHKVRYWGFLHPNCRSRLKQLQFVLNRESTPEDLFQQEEVNPVNPAPFTMPCPKCSEGIMRVTLWLPRMVRFYPPVSRAPT